MNNKNEIYSIQQLKELPYETLVEVISQLTPNEIIELSNKVGYPVFTRLCMGVKT